MNDPPVTGMKTQQSAELVSYLRELQWQSRLAIEASRERRESSACLMKKRAQQHRDRAE